MPPDYYQLGGFRSPINWFQYDDKNLAKTIAGDDSPLRPKNGDSKGPVELVLGIKHTGSSHLLLTESQIDRVVRAHPGLQRPRARPVPATAFESLSPIYFHAHELEKKLGQLKVKSSGQKSTDNSQSNKQFQSGEDGIQRGGFELGRLLYQLLHNNVEPGKYGLYAKPLPSSVRICSFVYNTPFKDERPSKDRLTTPILLDCGLAEATIPDLKHKAETSLHFTFSSQAFLNQGSARLDFVHGASESLASTVISARLQEFFKDYTQPTSQPMILLVHNEEQSLNALENLGVDTSLWARKSGLRKLFYETVKVKGEASPSFPSDTRRSYEKEPNGYEYRNNRPRSRSRSPRRSSGQSSYASRSSSFRDTRSPSRRHLEDYDYAQQRRNTYAPVYIVDIQEQYKKLMQTALGAGSVNKIAEHLGISKDLGWCAGNEAVLIIDVWRSMISGPAIDEQRTLRTIRQGRSRTAVKEPESADVTGDVGDESDMDPNDIVQTAVPQAVGDPDSGSDYGESDSD
ncbi:hypothetical protein Hypma_010899 [Hypsizygus marmoreus]|uniref:Uncharacterized protein n=1 Tax=Hypsizygus marmoreus TaxID=39966 RepID=A0A369JHZ4_HYPMA|nr:hypothetical protein Hypma_010899 [Hypsizygus marmoreus]